MQRCRHGWGGGNRIRRSGRRGGGNRGEPPFAGTRKRGVMSLAKERARQSSPSVICNYSDRYWPDGKILHKNSVEKAEVYIRKDSILKEKPFSACCDGICQRLVGQMVLVNSIIHRQESLTRAISWRPEMCLTRCEGTLHTHQIH